MALQQQTRTSLRAAIANSGAFKELKGLLEMNSVGVASATFSVAAEAANNIDTTIQCKDEFGNNVAGVRSLDINIVGQSGGTGFNANTYTVAATTGAVVEVVASKVLRVLTNSTGQAVIRLTNAGAVTCYLALVLPNGSQTVSAAIAHT